MILRLFLILLSFFTVFLSSAFAADINLRVSPIIYKISANPGDTMTRTVSVSNEDNKTYHLTTATSDFHAQDTTGRPEFVRKSELAYPDQELSSWITLGLDRLSLAPGATKKMDFTIKVPNNATPGGHYAAVFFQDHNAGKLAGPNQVGIHIDYGVLVLLTVNGDIVSTGAVNVDGVKIDTSTGPGGPATDHCPLGDLSPSPFDGSCVLPLFSPPTEVPTLTSHSGGDFSVNFTIPFVNDGNVHLAPQGKITIKDQSGNVVTGIGRAIESNDEGAITNQSIVDYIPINDAGGNTLPKTTRNYVMSWLGFPYMTLDDKGNSIMAYRSPTEFFSEKTARQGGFLYPWQRLVETIKTENYTADFEIAFTGADNTPQKTEFTREFQVSYPVIEKAMQPIVWLILVFALLWGLIYWYFLLARKYTYFSYFMEKYLGDDWQDQYRTSLSALRDYNRHENARYRKWLRKDIKNILKKHKNEKSLEEFLRKESTSYSPNMERKTHISWFNTLYKHSWN